LGVVIANHPKASELAKSLFSFKELMLVGFFLSVGMQGLPDVSML
jgi:predicted Kef-type K+ transport protein